jgi:hypothetical protein
MKKSLYIVFGLIFIFGCSDGPEIIPCIIIDVSNDIACPEIYEPVCGCNDVTYDNECYAELSGVSNWIEGECLD